MKIKFSENVSKVAWIVNALSVLPKIQFCLHLIKVSCELTQITNLTWSLDILSLSLNPVFLIDISRWILSPIWKISIRWTIARSKWESQERENRGTTRYVIIWNFNVYTAPQTFFPSSEYVDIHVQRLFFFQPVRA